MHHEFVIATLPFFYHPRQLGQGLGSLGVPHYITATPLCCLLSFFFSFFSFFFEYVQVCLYIFMLAWVLFRISDLLIIILGWVYTWGITIFYFCLVLYLLLLALPSKAWSNKLISCPFHECMVSISKCRIQLKCGENYYSPFVKWWWLILLLVMPIWGLWYNLQGMLWKST